jgi:hypothetical protein
MKEAYYFPHDSNARNDEKILELRDLLGWEGYGMYWAVIEMMRDSNDYTLSKSKVMLKQCLNIDENKVNNFLDKCFEMKLFIENNGRFYSESLMQRMSDIDEKRRKRAEAGRLGGLSTQSNAKAILKHHFKRGKASKVKESKVNNSNINYENTLIVAQENLKKELQLFLEKYGKDMLNDFFRYWSEANQGKTKCRYQLQKTWETSKRLITWYNRSNAGKN